MAANEEFDFSSDEENFESDWKFDENDDISQFIIASTIPSNADTNKDRKMGLDSLSKHKISRMDLNTAKAGMEGLDKEKINQIIHEASEGSRFYENEKKKEKQVQKRIEELQSKMASLSAEQKLKAKQTADKIVQELEQSRDLSRTIVHIDMDAFYAAVEMRDDPSLKSKPMAVGGNAMLCTSNYLARRYGVRAGMPGFIAKKLCPNLTIVSTNFEKYTKISHEIREVLAEYDRNFLPMSLDEAYLDITEYLSTMKSIGDSVEQERGIGRVKVEQTGENEMGNSDLGKAERTGDIQASAEMNQFDKIERKHLKQAGMILVEQETGNIDTIPNHDYEQVTRELNENKDVGMAQYKRDGNRSGQHKKEEVKHLQDAGPVVVKQETGNAEAMGDLNFEQVTKQLDGAVGLAEHQRNGKSSGQHKNEEIIVADRTDTLEMTSVRDNEHEVNKNYKESSHRILQEESAADQEMFYRKVEEVVKEMRRKIEERTQLTASAGIAPNMFLAKVCSDKNKPNGQYYLKPEKDRIMDFVRELPLRKAFGIGRVSEQILTSVLKVNTCSELYDRRNLMQLLFTPIACSNYLEISLGLGSTVVDVARERKSISTETTFREINKPEEHFAKCHQLCQELSDSLKEKGLTARKIGIKLKTVHFEVKTRVSTTSHPVQKAEQIFSHAKKLLVNEIRACSPEPLRLRLMGVRAAELCQKGIGNESKQQTILSLMKRRGSVPCCSPNWNAFQTAGPSKDATDQDDVSLKLDSASRPDEVGITQYCSDTTLSEQFTDDQLPFDQPDYHTLDGNIKLERSSSIDQDDSKKEPNTFNCPVCGRNLTFSSGNVLLQLNQHVDWCLSKQAFADTSRNAGFVQPTNQKHHTSKKRKRNSPNKVVKRRPMDRFLTKHMK